MKIFPLEEYLRIARDLEQYTLLFNRLWEAGKPIFTDEIPTSAVVLNKTDNVLEFLLNESFWNSLNNYTKTFVIAHECAHLLLRHGSRGAKFKKAFSPETLNIAMDIAINHLLVKYFNFNRTKIICERNLCWVDTVFPLNQQIPNDKAFEYYLELLKENSSQSSRLGNNIPMVLDNPSINDEEISKFIQEQIENEIIKQEDIDDMNNKFAGNESNLTSWIQINKKPPIKKKWITLIKKWHKDENDLEQWTRLNRRYVGLSNNFFLPTENAIEALEKKVKLCLFLDVSGSCEDARERFLIAAKSIPLEFFDIRTFAFDTETKEFDIEENKILVGRGTSFQCIEDTLKKMKKYPEEIWIFTDGASRKINPAYPQRWTWFLTFDGNKKYLPPKSKIYMLNEFE